MGRFQQHNALDVNSHGARPVHLALLSQHDALTTGLPRVALDLAAQSQEQRSMGLAALSHHQSSMSIEQQRSMSLAALSQLARGASLCVGAEGGLGENASDASNDALDLASQSQHQRSMSLGAEHQMVMSLAAEAQAQHQRAMRLAAQSQLARNELQFTQVFFFFTPVTDPRRSLSLNLEGP